MDESYQPAETLSPSVPSHASAAFEQLSKAEEECGDDEFWSVFCEPEAGSTSKQSPAELEEPADYCFEQEEFFSDEDMGFPDDSYSMKYPADRNSKRMRRASSGSSFQYRQPESGVMDVEEDACLSSHQIEKRQAPVFVKKRKRLIDEILGGESYHTPPSFAPRNRAGTSSEPPGLTPGSTSKPSSMPGSSATTGSTKPPTRSSVNISRPSYLSNTKPSSPTLRSDISGLDPKQAPSFRVFSQRTVLKSPQYSRRSLSGSLRANPPSLVAEHSTSFKENVPSLQDSLPPASSGSPVMTKLPTASHHSVHSPLKASCPPIGVPFQPTQEQYGREPAQLQPLGAYQPPALSDVHRKREVPRAHQTSAVCSFFTAGTVDG
jgi:hypothetical protein